MWRWADEIRVFKASCFRACVEAASGWMDAAGPVFVPGTAPIAVIGAAFVPPPADVGGLPAGDPGSGGSG